jgi:transcriptional regulator with XRE-family HTH domain
MCCCEQRTSRERAADREERKRRDWSQSQLEKMLAEKGIHLHWTTIAKIEKGERSVRIDEAAAIADLFDMSVDALLGRQLPDDTTLTFAMTTLLDYVRDADNKLVQARGTATDIDEQLEDAADRFASPHIEALQRTARDMARHLDKARAMARKLVLIASLASVDEGKETTK